MPCPPSETVAAADAALQAAGLPTYSEALRVLSLLADDLQSAIPALRKIGWQTHNEEGTLRRADAILDKASPGTARPPKAPAIAAGPRCICGQVRAWDCSACNHADAERLAMNARVSREPGTGESVAPAGSATNEDTKP